MPSGRGNPSQADSPWAPTAQWPTVAGSGYQPDGVGYDDTWRAGRVRDSAPPLWPQSRSDWSTAAPPEPPPAYRARPPLPVPPVLPERRQPERRQPERRSTAGHHRAASRRNWWLGGLVILLALVVVGGVVVGVRLADGDRSGAPGAGACPERETLRVAVPPEFAPVIEAALGTPSPDVTCPTTVVTTEEPAATLARLAKNPPDAWIAPSVAWLRLAEGTHSREAAKQSQSAAPVGLFAAHPVSLARTPVVVAAPRKYADSLGWPAKQPTWSELSMRTISGQLPRLCMDDPVRGTAGLLGVLGVHAAMARTTTDQGIAQMRALTVRSRLADSAADAGRQLRQMESETDAGAALRDVGVFPVTEQALYAYQRNRPAVPLAGMYPADGLFEADYPLALTAVAVNEPVHRQLAEHLAARLRAAEFADTLTLHGFRPATGTPGASAAPVADGLLARYAPPAVVPTDATQVYERVAQWSQYKRLSYQTLLLVDGSASMNDPVRDRSGNVTTKAELLRVAGAQAAQLFGLDTSIALWLFATPAPTSPPYVEIVPFGPLDEPLNGKPRREVLHQLAGAYRAYDRAGTPLYETVLRGTEAMRQRVKPGAVTLVVVLTDGRDEDTSYAMPRAEFLSKLAATRDPARPVPVFSIGYGADADMGILAEMGRLTGGGAVPSNDPSDLASAMAKVFLAAHTVR
jgi:Ca-activated chloride channel homolog